MKNNKSSEKIIELTADLQRVRADFENYRKRVDAEKDHVRASTSATVILKVIPIIDDIERAISHIPPEIEQNDWVQGIKSLTKKLDKSLVDLNIKKINSKSGVEFNPEIHDAVMFDEDSTGSKDIISEELRSGYKLGDEVIRPAMVKVAKK